MLIDDGAHEARIEALRRDSGIALGRDGDFRFRGGLVAHPRVQALFHRGIALKGGGEVAMHVGRWWCYVECAGPAFFVESLGHSKDGAGFAYLRGGKEVSLKGAVMGYALDRDCIYLWSKDILGPAVLLRSAHQDALMMIMEEGEAWFEAGGGGVLELTKCGARCVVLDAAPESPDAPSPVA